MKVKLKDGIKLTSMNNHCWLDTKVWTKLNQGKTVDFDEIPKHLEDELVVVSETKQVKPSNKKVDGGKE